MDDASARAAKFPLEVEPARVNLGVCSPCDPPLKTKVTIRNRTEAPITVKRLVSSCACTSAQIVGAREIGPGETRTVEIKVDISGVGGKSQRVDFAGDRGPIGVVRVDYEIVPPVQVLAETVDVGEGHATAEFKVARTDGKPVKLLRLEPAIGDVRTLPDGTQVAIVDLAKADAYADSAAGEKDGGFRRDADGTWTALYIAVVTDYPGCPNASVLVRRLR